MRLAKQFLRYGSPVVGSALALQMSLLAACEEPQFSMAQEADAARDGGAEDARPTPQDAQQPSADASNLAPRPCVDDPNVLGGECPAVVHCTSAGLCDLNERACCVSPTTASCTVRSTCDTDQRIRCDGPEDCAAGQSCCQEGGSLSCVDTASCNEGNRACHSDADCLRNRCVEGFPGTFLGVSVLYLQGSGICRGL